jgi:hypothetical protein
MPNGIWCFSRFEFLVEFDARKKGKTESRMGDGGLYSIFIIVTRNCYVL